VHDDPRRSERVASLLGIALGVSFTVCFLTGVYSHLAQQPPGWFTLPARPAGLYRLTQGLHVACGIASIPLLLAKLWTVYPKLFRWPPVRSLAHLLERVSLVPLVGGALFLLFSGTANIELWYPLPLFFPAGHGAVAWITIGALVVHVGAKATVARQALRRPVSSRSDGELAAQRRFLVSAGGAGALLTILTVGQTVTPLRQLALLAPRDPEVGSQGFPVNKAASEAGVEAAALDSAWRLRVHGAVERELSLSRTDLAALPQRAAGLPIACVEGWSASRTWTGVPLVDVLDLAGAATDSPVTVRSLEVGGLYGQSDVNAVQARDPDTLLALAVEGEPLSLDHGYPVRLIGPNRPGVVQTKWLAEVEVHG
jgi:DMSO/TMAO reductase YedYZ molybdopterin-dependent catalytic subunit